MNIPKVVRDLQPNSMPQCQSIAKGNNCKLGCRTFSLDIGMGKVVMLWDRPLELVPL